MTCVQTPGYEAIIQFNHVSGFPSGNLPGSKVAQNQRARLLKKALGSGLVASKV